MVPKYCKGSLSCHLPLTPVRGGGHAAQVALLGHTLIGAPVSRDCAASAQWLSCTRDTFPARGLVSRIIGRDSSQSRAAGVLLSGRDKSEIRDLLSRAVKQEGGVKLRVVRPQGKAKAAQTTVCGGGGVCVWGGGRVCTVCEAAG